MWRDMVSVEEGSKYYGQWNEKTAQRDGKGILITSGGAIYEGYYKNDKKNGRGRNIYANGYIYEGDYNDDMLHG